MSELVDPAEIECIVGEARRPNRHLGRTVSAERTVYILHSQRCKDSGIDLRECEHSRALDRGIEDIKEWEARQDEAVALAVVNGRLVPVRLYRITTQAGEQL